MMSLLTARPAAHVLDAEVFRRFWYPVAHISEVDEKPLSRHLLGVELVIWSTGPGEVAAAVNRCPHRDARLSTGWIDECNLVCPYHGWSFGADGAAAHIPQMSPGSTYPARAALTTFSAQERYGWVWVCISDEPLLDIPEIPEFESEGWRLIREPESDWNCTSLHLIDNNIDPAHIAFVHRESFGSPEKPDVEVPSVERRRPGLRFGYVVPVEGRPGELGSATIRTTSNQLHGPFIMLNRITYPDGVQHLMVKACTPSTSTTTHQLQMVFRNDTEQQRPAADVVAFDAQVWQEDLDVLEHCWTDFSLDLVDNVHLKTDKASIEYRRWLAELVSTGALPSAEVGAS
jgi:phenylpropionate dioxygenase-like ring-hydroxylating dioxygenase large terminal subunit